MRTITVLTAAAVMAGSAFAGITTDLSNHKNPSKFRDGNVTISGANFTNQAVRGGAYTWDSSNSLIPGWGFCIELPQAPVNGTYTVIDLSSGPLPDQFGTPMGTSKADDIRELFGKFFEFNWITNNQPGDGAKLEAFSVAVWEIVYETDLSYDVTSGSGFSASNLDSGLANSWLSQLDGTGLATNLVAITNANGQDFLVAIPAPGAVLLGLIGCGAIGALRRRLA
jgi:hypothetical protein